MQQGSPARTCFQQTCPVAVALLVVEEAAPIGMLSAGRAPMKMRQQRDVEDAPRLEAVLGGWEEIGHGGNLSRLNRGFHSVFNGLDAQIRSALS